MEVKQPLIDHMRSINSNWRAFEIHKFVETSFKFIMPRLQKHYETESYAAPVYKKIINTIQKKLPKIIPHIQFKKLKNGYYQYSWLDSDLYERTDANPVLRYIKKNENIANEILNDAFNWTIDDFQKYYPLSWREFINLLIRNPLIIEKLHLAVRKYIVNLNKDIVLRKSNEIINIKDDNKIITINDQGDLIDSQGNEVNNDSHDKLILDFNPRNDEQRERPLVIIREHLENNQYKDHIIIGRRGANHGSIINAKKYQDLLQRSILPGEYNPTIACAYVIGKICVIDNRRGFFPSVQAIRDSLKESGKFAKIYIMPEDDPILFRLAKKLI